MNSNYKRNIRHKKWLEAGKCCAYCRKNIPLEKVTLDHVVPKAMGGSNSVHNLACSCWRCNQKKASRPPHEFHAALMMGLA